MKQDEKKKKGADYEKIGILLEDIVAVGYGKPWKLMWYSFIRGLAYGVGIFLAGTVVVGLVIWGLSLFNDIPVIGRFVQNIVNSLSNH
ncbi:MAG: DUF5665 domain-containing protein [Patescibacteria group bacterium]